MLNLIKCEPLMDGDDHGGQGHCGLIYDPDDQWTICPHNVKDGPDSIRANPPLRRAKNPFRYLSATLEEVHVTSVPYNLDEALDYFTLVLSWARGRTRWIPKYIQSRPAGTSESEYKMLPFEYHHETDEWSDLVFPSAT